jgi:hypothetical protein
MPGRGTACVVVLTCAVACSSAPASAVSDAATEQDGECYSLGLRTTDGAVRVHLRVAYAGLLQGVTFVVTGPSPSLPRYLEAYVPIGDASDVFDWGGLPAGGPDTIQIQDAAVAPGVTCDGSATFSIVACTTIDVPLDVTCTAPPDGGDGD